MSKTKDSKTGPLVFTAVLIAVLAFFWWLLIYKHGVVATH